MFELLTSCAFTVPACIVSVTWIICRLIRKANEDDHRHARALEEMKINEKLLLPSGTKKEE